MLLSLSAAALALAGCAGTGDIVDGGITQIRSACPAVGVPAGTGDVTLFDPANSTLASAIDVTATITNVRSTCGEGGSEIVTGVTFDVIALRRDVGAARAVTLPYFTAVIQGGNAVVAKRTGQVVLNFAAGEARAQTSISAGASVDRAAAELPDDIEEQITRKREVGDPDAAIDPLSLPAVRQAVLRASFEVLVGFQLTQEQLRYNATR
ncbi:hypothetical protein D1610_05035 [Sphingomonas gilva]|uniref:Uncharacterized protein n=1 Tax=Sphingomonas gilva TaxID=2305907 RepID=A0A396RSZ8_9SPHN|nr:hypothetical protein D1610_05035 [Sphingomonas gilva]